MIEREFLITLNAKSQGRKSHSKSQNFPAKLLHKKDTHVYNNCYELRSRAINKISKVPCKGYFARSCNAVLEFLRVVHLIVVDIREGRN